MSFSILNDSTISSISNPVADIEVVTIQVPGVTGPTGPKGDSGPANVLTIGSVTTGAPGTSATATITGVAPTQTLNLNIPQGPTGTTGPAGAAANMTIGTVTTVAGTGNGSASITGTAPNYLLNLTLPRGYGVNAGGATGAVLAKNSATDYDTVWVNPTSSPTASQIVLRDANGRAQVADPSASADIATKNYTDGLRRVATNNQSATAYTFALTDEGKVVFYNVDSSAVAYTIPTNATVAFPVGSWIDVYQGSTGAVTVSGAAGVTLRGPDGSSSITLRAQYSKVRITKSSTDTWQWSGDAVTVSTTATTNATASAFTGTLVKRDANGRAQMVDPAVAQDIATKNYADTKASSSITISAGTGLTGGGDLTAPRTLTVAYGSTAGTAVQGNDTRVTADQAAGVASIRTIGTGAVQAAAGNHTHTSTGITDATSAATPNVIISRDANGRASVADPSASTDISTKNYTDTQIATARRPAVNSQTANYTLVLTDERKIVQMNSASATTVTIPLNSSVAFAVGTIIEVQMLGTGAVTISPTAGVTVNSTLPSYVLTRQNSVILLQKVGTDTWNLDRISNASATAVSTANTLMLRDSNGRASVVDPSASTDIATKNYVDNAVSPKVTGSGVSTVTVMTQAAYTALGSYSSTTLYIIQG